MADQWNLNQPLVGNQIANDIPDIEETLGWFHQILRMLIGWKDSSIATVSPPGEQRSQFLWKDGDEIYIEPGRYFHDGTTRQMVFWDAQLTFQLQAAGTNADSSNYGVDGWHYIYLDDSAIVTIAASELDNTCFLNSTTAPTWSDAKHGYYNGSDRCIFAVFETGGVILEFYHDGGGCVYFADQLAGGKTAITDFDFIDYDIDTTWTDCYLCVPGFVTRSLITVYGNFSAAASTFAYWRTNGQTGTTGHTVLYGWNAIAQRQANTLSVMNDASQIIELKFSSSDNSFLSVYVNGWHFPKGM